MRVGPQRAANSSSLGEAEAVDGFEEACSKCRCSPGRSASFRYVPYTSDRPVMTSRYSDVQKVRRVCSSMPERMSEEFLSCWSDLRPSAACSSGKSQYNRPRHCCCLTEWGVTSNCHMEEGFEPARE